MKYKAVVFDFNGTLLFDTPFHNIAWQKMVQEITGCDLNDTLKVKMHGKNNLEILYSIKEDMTLEENKLYSLRKEELYRSICMENKEALYLVPGAIEWFETLEKKGIPFTIASASIKENIDFFIKTFSLDTWFNPSKIIYDNGLYHDKVGMFKDACSLLGVEPKDVIIVEDSVTGISHAKTVGAGCIIGIGSKETHPKLKQLGATLCIEEYLDLDINQYI